ncbi:MAG: glycosyltransferase family 2 protein [Acidobacteriota bacterium]
MKLIIQIPCFNEETTLPVTLQQLPRHLPGIDRIEFLVIDDGSADETVQSARRLGVDHILRFGQHRGLASAFRAGLEECLRQGADLIVNTDGDNQYSGEDVSLLVQPILAGNADLVVGSRDIQGIPHFSLVKKWLQKGGSWIVRKAAGCAIPDATSGFRAYTREAALQTIVHSKFSYTLETLIQAGSSDLRVATVPVRVNPKLRESRLAGSTWDYVKRSAATIVRIYAMYHPLRVFSAIGLAGILAGVLLGLRYLYFYFAQASSGHIQSLILSAVLMIVGFQIVVIGLVADLIRANRRLSEELLYRVRRMEHVEGRTGPALDTEKPIAVASSRRSRR